MYHNTGYPFCVVTFKISLCVPQVLDASFDDILPLAVPRMPSSLEPVVRRTMRDYINLNIAEQLIKYPGPVQLIRRTDDEIICTE